MRDGDGDAACIANSALHANGVAAHKLLFGRRHRRGGVLCDEACSCATPGHVVALNGRPLSMRGYCTEAGGCARMVNWVNIPKFERGWRMASRTPGLQYTAFAVQFETRVEEGALQIAIRAGL